jgi:hypothetical protein
MGETKENHAWKRHRRSEPAKILQVTKDAVAFVTKEGWEVFCRHTETVEIQCWERDCILPDVINRIVINLNPSNDSDSDRKNSETDSQKWHCQWVQ